MLEFCLVLAERQNAFFFELAEAIADELRELGHQASISTSGFPEAREDRVYILVPPHEYYALEGLQTEPRWEVLQRTIFICAEQPGTSFFKDDVFLADRAGAIFDINRFSIAEFARRGVKGVRHLPLGWTPSWSTVEFAPGEQAPKVLDRDIDVLHLGINSANRATAIAAAAPHLARWNALLLMGDDHRANREQTANFVVADRKRELLRRSRVLLNLHVGARPYFEWLRVVEAICGGALVVSEHSIDVAPLVPGEHFLAGHAHSLGLLAQHPLDDEQERFAMARDAWLFLKAEQPFRRSVQGLVEAGHEIAANPLPATGQLTTFARRIRDTRHLRGVAAEPERYPSDVSSPDGSRARAALKDLRLDMMALRRDLDRAEGDGEPARSLVAMAHDSPAYAGARPRVSVITALYNYERHIAEALESAGRSDFTDLELVIVDDGSTDGSLAAAVAWAQRTPYVATRIVRHTVNRGLGAARNTAVDVARGEYVFVLDADNSVYREGIGKLVRALDAEPAATFAYGMLEQFDLDGPLGLHSVFPWQPWRFRSGNFIDAMALVRRSWLLAHGGYATDRRLHGWEDYDLWCRVAEHDGFGLHVPQVVARYRVTKHSMLTLTDISSVQAVSMLIERHPKLLAGVEPPL